MRTSSARRRARSPAFCSRKRSLPARCGSTTRSARSFPKCISPIRASRRRRSASSRRIAPGLPAMPSNLFPRNVDDPYVGYDVAALQRVSRARAARARTSARIAIPISASRCSAKRSRARTARTIATLLASEVLAPLALSAERLRLGAAARRRLSRRQAGAALAAPGASRRPSGLRATLSDLDAIRGRAAASRCEPAARRDTARARAARDRGRRRDRARLADRSGRVRRTELAAALAGRHHRRLRELHRTSHRSAARGRAARQRGRRSQRARTQRCSPTAAHRRRRRNCCR